MNVDIEFSKKIDMYIYYGINIKTLPKWHVVKMRYNRINSKRSRLYKLVKKWIDYMLTLYFSCKEMTALTELFTINDMDRLKYELARLVESKDYKTVNALLRRNPNTWLFNTRELNEEIPYDKKHFTIFETKIRDQT